MRITHHIRALLPLLLVIALAADLKVRPSTLFELRRGHAEALRAMADATYGAQNKIYWGDEVPAGWSGKWPVEAANGGRAFRVHADDVVGAEPGVHHRAAGEDESICTS